MMSLGHWFLVAGFGFFLGTVLFQAVLLGRTRHTKDWSEPRGSAAKGIAYAMTTAMLPTRKETARLHKPTYFAGIAYHAGSFLALLWLVPFFFDVSMPNSIRIVSAWLLLLTSLCGTALLLKRMLNKKLKDLSALDDYFSNIIVTGFQVLAALVLLSVAPVAALFIYTAILFFYIPIGKLRHILYFLPARVYLGWLYGKRGVWPPKRLGE